MVVGRVQRTSTRQAAEVEVEEEVPSAAAWAAAAAERLSPSLSPSLAGVPLVGLAGGVLILPAEGACWDGWMAMDRRA